MTTLPAVLKLARHPERLPVTRIDALFVAMAVAVCDSRATPHHRIQILRAIFQAMKRVELSETLSPKLAKIWMANVFALVFKTDSRTTDMHSVQAFRLMFDLEVWAATLMPELDQVPELDQKSDSETVAA